MAGWRGISKIFYDWRWGMVSVGWIRGGGGGRALTLVLSRGEKEENGDFSGTRPPIAVMPPEWTREATLDTTAARRQSGISSYPKHLSAGTVPCHFRFDCLSRSC